MLVTQRGWSEQCDIWHKKKFLDAISSVQMDPDPGEQGVLSEHLSRHYGSHESSSGGHQGLVA